jgi:hypothetical protein
MDSFNSFNISCIPRENNIKYDSLAIVASLFNLDDSQNKITFHVKIIFRPLIPDNQEYSPDGVSECAAWQAMGEGTGHRGMPPRDELVPQPTTLPDA